MVTAYYGKDKGKIMRRELLPQFYSNSHEIWYRCLPWCVDVARHIFFFTRLASKCIAHGNAILWQKWGENLCIANYFLRLITVTSSWNLAQMFASGCRCARCIFRHVAYTVRCYGNSILRQKIRTHTGHFAILHFKSIYSDILHTWWHVRWCVRYPLFDSGGKCVTIVTAYEGKKITQTLRIVHTIHTP